MMLHTQSALSALMVYPTTFGFDDQTAQTNAFQHRLNLTSAQLTSRATGEFEALVATLRRSGIHVMTFQDTANPPKPNAVFPNNWLSTWPDGRIYLYPMATESRRRERSPVLLQQLKDHFKVTGIIDLSSSESTGTYLESTGVLVFDHMHRHAYACISPRCDRTLFEHHARQLGYKPIALHATDDKGVAVYHTNLLMGIQTTTAVVCLESIRDDAEREQVVTSLQQTGHTIIDITLDQMTRFCGNVLELHNQAGEQFLIISQGAYDALTSQQRATLGQDKTLLPVAVPIIEAIGGGSVRCMVAELFLPLR